MIIDYSKPYSPSGMAAPMSGDAVMIRWEAPLNPGRRITTTWEVITKVKLESPMSADPVKLDRWPHRLSQSRIVRVSAWTD